MDTFLNNREGDLRSDLPRIGRGTPISRGSQQQETQVGGGRMVEDRNGGNGLVESVVQLLCWLAFLGVVIWLSLTFIQWFQNIYKWFRWKQKKKKKKVEKKPKSILGKGNNWDCCTQHHSTKQVRFDRLDLRVYELERGQKMIRCAPVIAYWKKMKTEKALECRRKGRDRVKSWAETHCRIVARNNSFMSRPARRSVMSRIKIQRRKRKRQAELERVNEVADEEAQENLDPQVVEASVEDGMEDDIGMDDEDDDMEAQVMEAAVEEAATDEKALEDFEPGEMDDGEDDGMESQVMEAVVEEAATDEEGLEDFDPGGMDSEDGDKESQVMEAAVEEAATRVPRARRKEIEMLLENASGFLDGRFDLGSTISADGYRRSLRVAQQSQPMLGSGRGPRGRFSLRVRNREEASS